MQFLYRTTWLNTFLLVLIVLTFPFSGSGKNSLDDHVFFSCETNGNISKELSIGYRAFILLPDTNTKTILNEISKFLFENNNEIISVIIQEDAHGFIKQLEASGAKDFVVLPTENSTDDLAACKSKGKRLFIFTPQSTPFSFAIEHCICKYNVGVGFPEKIYDELAGKRENKLVIFNQRYLTPDSPDSLRESSELIPRLFSTYTGKLPNFYVTKNKESFAAYYQWFSKNTWYSANVEYNEKQLSGIRWKEMPEMLSFGKIHTTNDVISPYKNGYHFSPDVFNFNSQTAKSTKIFYARQRDLSDEMVLYLEFEQNITNAAGENTEVPYSNVEFIKDNTRGWCAVFNNRDNYIDFDTDIITFDETFTVSAWVKPAAINGNRSIIGKGKAWAVKFRDGHMLFTSPGIMDHVTDSVVVNNNEWQHLTYVISSGETVSFYKNGVLVSTQKAEIIEPTDHSLLIGTNLWDESFNGMMDDLMVWDRILSKEEVLRLYNEGPGGGTKSANSNYLLKILSSIVFVILFFLFLKEWKKKAKRKSKYKKIEDRSREKIQAPSVELFGGFKITNRNNEDLTSRFSTRRKQFFILVLIETLRQKGISSKQLTNNLWAGYSSESAKNNRSTQVQRIRETLAQSSGIEIAYNEKKWVLNFNADVYCDLASYFKLIEQFKLSENEGFDYELVVEILFIIEKGTLLPNMDDEWLDEFKSKISDELLETLSPLYLDEDFSKNTKLVLRLSKALMIFDPLNENILKHKVGALVKLGKNTQAQECLEHFKKVYQQCYDQPYGMSVNQLLNKN